MRDVKNKWLSMEITGMWEECNIKILTKHFIIKKEKQICVHKYNRIFYCVYGS